MRTWKKRYFVVEHDGRQVVFSYYKDERHMDKPLGQFSLLTVDQLRLLEPPRSPLGDKPVMEVEARQPAPCILGKAMHF